MPNGLRGSVVNAPPVRRVGRSLRSDPSLPRTLVGLVLAGSADAGARESRQSTAPARPLPRSVPPAIAAEMPPNILYRRFPLVTSLLVELDELRHGVIRPTLRRR